MIVNLLNINDISLRYFQTIIEYQITIKKLH